jgi:TerC family integral membrane protein
MSDTFILVLFFIVVLVMLALDLGVFQKRPHFPSVKEAAAWTAVWFLLAMLFCLFIWLNHGSGKALEYLTGYVVEEALSVDNVFVFIVILTYFAVPKEIHHAVLFWGVLSAIVFRAVFILVGSALVSQFHWILYLLGAFLIVTAVKLAIQRDAEVDPERNPFIRLARKFFPVTQRYEGKKFFVRTGSKWSMTPLFLVLLTIETTDIAFATDSIPAIFAITRDAFIIFTSNIFAVLGLRSLYFLVAGFMGQFRFLKYGLSAVLAFIGVKMLAERWVEIPIHISLLVIFLVLLAAIVASVLHPERKDSPARP